MYYKHIKPALQTVLDLLVLILILWPWTLALGDLAYWGIHGAQLTTIPWGQLRGVVLLIWPVAALLSVNLLFN